MLTLTLAALPSLVATALLPLLGVVTFFIERGSRRGRGMAGFFVLFGLATGCAFVMLNTPPVAPAPTRALRLMVGIGSLAYIPMLWFLSDLAERSGHERPAGLPLVPARRVLAAIGVLDALLSAGTPWVVARAKLYPLGVWGPEPGPAAWLIPIGGAAFVAWGAACWNAERRRRGRAQADLVVWAAAILLLIGGPIILGPLLLAVGVSVLGPYTPAATLLGAIATLAGLVLSRDIELARLRIVGSSPQSPRATATGSDSSNQAARMVLGCLECGAIYQKLSPDGVCARDGTPVELRPDPMLGLVVGGCYRVLRFLGAGGMGRVYAAEHARLGVRYALKVPWGDLLGGDAQIARFLREARAASALVSRHLVRIQDLGEIRPGLPFILMELVEGRSLADILARAGAIRPESVALIGGQLAEGLAVAHAAGVVHRDLKPDNVIIVRLANDDTAKIVDFGLARLLGPPDTPPTQLTTTGAVLGTPAYMAPEQLRGEPAGRAADLYALGVLMYELATGHVPFAGTPVQMMLRHLNETPPPLPEGGPLAAIVAALLQKDPARRERAAEGLGQSLATLAGGVSRVLPLGRPPIGPALPRVSDNADTLPV